MKKTIFITLLLCFGLMASAQSKWIGFKGFFQPTTKENLQKYAGTKSLTDGVLQVRFDVGVRAAAFYPMSTMDPKVRPLDKMAGGLFFTHVQESGFSDWAAGVLLLLPNIAGEKYGVGVAGAYSIFKVGVGYDIGGIIFMDRPTN
jgi:hypothetical protein